MDIYLNWDNEKKSILLPINPESFEISGSQNNQSVYVHNMGELNLKGKRGLYGLTLESFFPAQKYSFQHGEFHEPYDYYCKKLKTLYESNTTVHLIITETDINMFCTIETFTHGEADQTGDVKYSLALKEYREVVAAKRKATKKKTTKKRISTKPKIVSYTWKKGDTWSKVVKKCLGSSKTWKTVRKNNQSVINKAKKKHPKKKETTALIGYKVVVK